MPTPDQSELSPMRRAVNAAALTLILVAFGDWLGNVYSLQIGNVQWRYGAFGLLVNGMLPVVVGLLIGGISAWYFADRAAGRLWATLSFLVAAGLLGGVLLFALDSVQVRASVPGERLMVFRIGVGITVLKVLLTSTVLVLIGRGTLRCIPRNTKSSRDPASVVIGTGA